MARASKKHITTCVEPNGMHRETHIPTNTGVELLGTFACGETIERCKTTRVCTQLRTHSHKVPTRAK